MNKKDEILNAVFKLFAQKGYETSMSDIAKEVGIKAPSLYSHFKNKNEMIDLTIHHEMEKCQDFLLKEILTNNQDSSEKQLKNFSFSVMQYFENPEINRFWNHLLLLDQRRMQSKSAIINFNSKLFEEIRTIIEEGMKKKEIKEGDLEGDTYLYLAMLHGMLSNFFSYYGMTLDRNVCIEKIWNTYWNGIKR